RRLSLIETVYDIGTTSCLTALGVDAGWRCLEIGAGGGSIARWLCDRVGPTGSVAAVDLEPKFLEADPRPNLEIHRGDIIADGIPGDGYDLVHARFLFMHLPDRERLIADAAGRLRPGGVILLEEADMSFVEAAGASPFAEVWAASAALSAKTGGDWYWAAKLPMCLAACGLEDVRGIFDGQILPGQSPWAELTQLTFEQLTPQLVADGHPPELMASAIAELSDTTRWFPMANVVRCWGRRP
ncbi:MAG: class I SAM-dependent methyltransferase, partial [Actinobacteria bacterium]|nr:class I SAM-dependent methyltransferase [Actinomycetota bacterium]